MVDKKKKDVVQKYVSDMLALNRQIHEAADQQVESDDVRKYPDAHALSLRIRNTLAGQIDTLEQHLEGIGGGGGLKEAVTSVTGTVGGWFSDIRSEEVSKMMRDNYTSLNLAAISLTMLHTTGLSLGGLQTAELAQQCLKEITPLISDTARLIPNIVVDELAEAVDMTNTNVVKEVNRHTAEAWETAYAFSDLGYDQA